MHDDTTPIDGRDPITQLYEEMRDLKLHCQRIADNAMLQSEEIPKLHKRIDAVVRWQVWFPTAAITIAVIVRIFIR